MNSLQACVTDPATGAVTIDGQPVTLGRPLAAGPGSEIPFALRPEALSLGAQPGNDATLRGKVEEVSFLGSVVRIRAALDAQRVSFDTFNTIAMRPPALGDTVDISFSTADALVTEA